MTLVKDDLAKMLYNQSGFSKHKSRDVVETVFELVKKALESGEDVLISGFEKFTIKRKAPRKGRNPATGEELPLDARTVVVFRCSPVLCRSPLFTKHFRFFIKEELCQSATGKIPEILEKEISHEVAQKSILLQSVGYGQIWNNLRP